MYTVRNDRRHPREELPRTDLEDVIQLTRLKLRVHTLHNDVIEHKLLSSSAYDPLRNGIKFDFDPPQV